MMQKKVTLPHTFRVSVTDAKTPSMSAVPTAPPTPTGQIVKI